YSPAGVAAMELGSGIATGRPAVGWASNLLPPRGRARLPTTCHSDPLLIRISGPLRPAAIRRGVISAAFELKGMGGKFTRPTVCSWSGSMMLMFSLPEFATYRVL